MNEEFSFHRGPSKKHSEFHVVPTRQAEINFPGEFTEGDGDSDERANLFMPSRIAHGAIPDDGGVALDDRVVFVLIGMHGKADTLRVVGGVVTLQRKGMNRRGAGPGIDLRLDMRDIQGGNGEPLSPANKRK